MSASLFKKIDQLNQVGIALSAQSDTAKLMEQILTSAQLLTEADGGTLYRLANHNELHFDVLQNTSLNIQLGGTHPQPVTLDPILLRNTDNTDNLSTVASYVAIKQQTVNIEDIYTDENFDFKGALNFDQAMHYRTQSMLTIPLKNFDNDTIGVLQLINAKDDNGQTIAFSEESKSLASSLASQASVALTNRQLINEHKQLFEAFSQLVADAIDKKSPYTGSHCKRVPILTMLLAQAANRSQHPDFKDFSLNEAQLFEIKTAAWLHDCGKLATPEYIMDKSTKLETIFDRIEEIKTRFNVKAFQDLAEKYGIPKTEIQATQAHYLKQYQHLNHINSGGEFLAPKDLEFVERWEQQTIQTLEGEVVPFLSLEEATNLKIERGPLNDEEREIMQDHAAISIDMLSILPFPKELRHVAEIAGGHHERMDGQGYPNHLTESQLSIPARIMGIADIFEALSAGDRPYKKAKTLSESLRILGFMKKEGHINGELFNLFIREKVYLDYAKAHLKPEQIDEVDHDKIPGFEG